MRKFLTGNLTILIISIWLLTSFHLFAQIDDACKLQFGTNLGGLVDYGTELPFVDLMHNAREWYTKDIGNPDDPFDSGHAADLAYRSDGYPTHVPQTLAGTPYPQRVVTIWAITTGWPAGQYTVLWEGTGTLQFWGGYENLNQTSSNRLTFDFFDTEENVIEMTIVTSDINDPIHNIRLLMPGTENTYESQPFHQLWIDKLSIFPSVRFMDWGMTNSWGQPDNWTWDDPSLFSWNDRAQMDDYTWATNKGIPYEMMIRLLNDFDLDGWVCVPHRASDEYIQNMAMLFREELETDRHLTVEYSNEIWNWIFGQAQWLNKYGCEQNNVSWPEGVVPYVQNCLDIWTNEFAGELDRLTRVVGVHTAWQDVSNRMANNMTPGSFDAISPTYYFGITDEGDAALDILGANATTSDISFYAREGMQASKIWLQTQKEELADLLGLPLIFYEGGQHITPHPFGEEPSYAQALLDIQRDTAMFNMYNEWFEFLRTLQDGENPIPLMNFSFIAERSARYGSWGILETMDQDTTLVPAPKYASILQSINACNNINTSSQQAPEEEEYSFLPNPVSSHLTIYGDLTKSEISFFNPLGEMVFQKYISADSAIIDVDHLEAGIYFIHIKNDSTDFTHKIIISNL